ncbi:MAG: glycosyltransferase [Candidatus Bathyarchaeota archaeon]|nr:glycosyltransferase [Candidatus Bathyarchaeota archaeon]
MSNLEKSKSPFFSIIIPTLNEEKIIRNTLKALREQMCKNFEIIVVDANSTDATRKEATNYADKILVVKKRRRQYQMNVGAEQAIGKYLIFLYADTILPSSCLKRIKDYVIELMVICGGGKIRFTPNRPRYIVLKKFREFVCRLLTIFGTSPFLFVRRDIFVKLGGFNENIGEEGLDLCKRAKRLGKVILTDIEIEVSARRFEKGHFFRNLFSWAFLVTLSYFGIHSTSLEDKIYRPIR